MYDGKLIFQFYNGLFSFDLNVTRKTLLDISWSLIFENE